ncbi:MAG: biotin transporter BioY [Clostridia bacterium]|nr:biotin transporter BioY [Clostridia bacterium]
MNTRRLIRISLFTLLTIIGGYIHIPVGYICFTFQTLFVMMSGLFLGAKDGAISQIAYLLLGLIGLPVFAHGGGFSYVFQPSFGYLIGFVFGATMAGALAKNQSKKLLLWLDLVVSLLVIYIIGVAYQAVILLFVNGLAPQAVAISLLTVALMFVVDCFLLYLVTLVYPKLKKIIN